MNFEIKMTITFLLSFGIFYIMMKIQDRKEREAEEKFRFTLKTRGINPDLEDSDDSTTKK